jgi:uncharacterized protein
MSPSTVDSKAVDAKAVCLFYGVAFSLNWLLALPLWLSGQGLHIPIALGVLTVTMFTPAAGVIAVRVFLPKSIQPIIRVTGLGIGKWPSCLQYCLFGWFAISAPALAAPFVGALLGMYRLDLHDFSGLRQLLRQQPGAETVLENVPLRTLLYPICSTSDSARH